MLIEGADVIDKHLNWQRVSVSWVCRECVYVCDIQGGVIVIGIEWQCDLDWSIDYCLPKYSFSRLDQEKAKIAKGSNFRSVHSLSTSAHESSSLCWELLTPPSTSMCSVGLSVCLSVCLQRELRSCWWSGVPVWSTCVIYATTLYSQVLVTCSDDVSSPATAKSESESESMSCSLESKPESESESIYTSHQNVSKWKT